MQIFQSLSFYNVSLQFLKAGLYQVFITFLSLHLDKGLFLGFSFLFTFSLKNPTKLKPEILQIQKTLRNLKWCVIMSSFVLCKKTKHCMPSLAETIINSLTLSDWKSQVLHLGFFSSFWDKTYRGRLSKKYGTYKIYSYKWNLAFIQSMNIVYRTHQTLTLQPQSRGVTWNE